MKKIFLTKFNKIKGKKSGISTIEFVIAMLIFLVVFALFFNLFILFWQISQASSLQGYLSRTMSVQGGFESSAPEGFSSTDGEYITKEKIETYIEDA